MDIGGGRERERRIDAEMHRKNAFLEKWLKVSSTIIIALPLALKF